MKEVTTEPTVDLKLQEWFGYVMMGYKVHQTGGGAGGEDAGGNFAWGMCSMNRKQHS